MTTRDVRAMTGLFVAFLREERMQPTRRATDRSPRARPCMLVTGPRPAGRSRSRSTCCWRTAGHGASAMRGPVCAKELASEMVRGALNDERFIGELAVG